MTSALLLSGGMDSLAVAWWLRPTVAITIDYGQLAAKAEVNASTTICKHLSIEHHIITVDCGFLGSGDMSGREANCNAAESDWWPYRNQLLVTLSAMKCLTLGVTNILLGTVKSDGEQHKDGSAIFIEKICDLMSYQEGGITVQAPAINLTTADLIERSGVPEKFLSWAHSCHKSNVACGQCRGCNKYFEVWEELRNALD